MTLCEKVFERRLPFTKAPKSVAFERYLSEATIEYLVCLSSISSANFAETNDARPKRRRIPKEGSLVISPIFGATGDQITSLHASTLHVSIMVTFSCRAGSKKIPPKPDFQSRSYCLQIEKGFFPGPR